MIHNTLKTPEPLGRSPRSTHSPAQRRLWRYSVGCRGSPSSAAAAAAAASTTTSTISATTLTQTHRRSVCVLAADLEGGGGGGGGGEGVVHTIHGLCHLCIGCRLPQVNILRGKDGYGFTICSDSPVRVQAVDPGGPADQAGLQHLDTLLQLNGQPVEQWKCIDLAHAIRNSSNEIRLVVWRTGPTAKPSFEGLLHRPSYKPSTSNYDAPSPPTRRRGGGAVPSKTPPAVPPLPAHHRPTAATSATRRLLLNGSEAGGAGGGGGGGGGGLGPGWGGRVGSAEELDGRPRAQQHQQQQQQQQHQQHHHLLHHPHATATLKGTRVKASNGDNYIILAPISAGSQVPQSAAAELHLHHHHLLHHHPPHPHRGHVVAHPRYVSLPYIPDATS